MDLQSAIRHMASRAQRAYAQISRAIGRNDRYVSIMLNDGTTPRLDLMAKIANACGYRLVMVGHGEGLEVVPVAGDDGVSVAVDCSWSVADGDGGVLVLTPDGGAAAASGAVAGGADDATQTMDRDAIIDSLIAQLEGMRER